MDTYTTTTATVIIKNLLYIPAALLIGSITTESYAVLTAFMTVDFVLGVLRVGIVRGGDAIKSYKMVAGLCSKMLVTCVPLVVFWAGRGAQIDLGLLAQWSVGILVLAQAYSILGHINSIRLRRDVQEYDIVSALLCQLRTVFETLIKDSHSR